MARRVEQPAPVQSFQLCAVLLLAACSGTAESQPSFSPAPSTPASDGTITVGEASKPYVQTKAIALEAAAPVVRAPARLAFRDGAVSQINLPVPGRVTEVHVKTGDKVKAGAPLLTLSSPEAAAARAALAAAQAEHEAARKELARQDQMATSGVGIDSERVAAQAKLKQSDAELARASSTASLLGGGGGSVIVLRAPFDGTVIARRATVGTAAEPGGEPLIEIGNPTSLWVVAEVFERDLVQVHEGADVDIEITTNDKPLHGKVVTVGSALTGSLRTAPVYIALDGNTTDVRAGMFARATIKAPAGQSIVLPAEAVLVKNGKKYVVYVEDHGKYRAREVSVGRSVDGAVQILSGLTVGENVIVKGALLVDGAAEQLL
ncbi:MAG: efflux RND transporter periplasmic adaptor subunit [Kofleriaceae bacterium]|nr:efflux RND transporter periplasmic adaptor subunit [Kofleriaceae bacterium]